MKWKVCLVVFLAAILLTTCASAKVIITPLQHKPIILKPTSVISTKSETSSVPNTGVSLTPSEALNKSKVLIKLTPMYLVNGAGAAFFPYNNIVVFYDGSTCRTPLFYDAEQNLFATVGPVKVMNVDTGKIVAAYSPPPGYAAIFKVTHDGKIVVIQTVNTYEGIGTMSSIVLCPAGVAICNTGEGPLVAYPEVIYPNGTIVFGSTQTLVGFNTTTKTFIWKYTSNYTFQEGVPSVNLSSQIISSIITHTTNYNVTPPTFGAFDDLYVGHVLGGDGRLYWCVAVTGQYAMSPNPQDWNITTPDGVNFNLTKYPVPFWSGDIIFTRILSPTFTNTTSVPGNTIVSGSTVVPGLNAEYIPEEWTKICDGDIELPVGAKYWVMADNAWANNIALINLYTGEVSDYAGTPVVSHGLNTHPIYISGIATQDGRYVILLKCTDAGIGYTHGTFAATKLPVRIEVWEHSGNTLTLIKTIDYNLTLSTETTQPRSMGGIAKMGPWQYYALPGGIIIYDTYTHTLRFYGFNGTYSGRLAAVAPGGQYCVLGNTVFRIDYLLNIPSIIYDGKVYLYSNAKDKNLMSPIVYDIPSSVDKYGYTMRILSGTIKIGSIYSKKMSVNLTSDKYISSGQLYKMYKEGLIRSFQYTNVKGNGTVEDQKIVEGSYGVTCIDYIRKHVLKPWAPYIAVGKVGSAVDIDIPLNVKVPVSQFSSINLAYALSYGTIVPVYEGNKLFGISYSEFGVGVSSAVGGYLAWQALKSYAPSIIYDQIPVEYSEAVPLTSTGELASTVLSKAAPVIGIATIVDGVAGYILDQNTMHNTEMRTYLMVAPVFQDSVTGQRYTVVTLFLPSSVNKDEWTGYAGEMLQKIGIKNYVIRVVTIGTNWDDYLQVMAHMSKKDYAKQVNLLAGLNDLSAMYGVTPNRLKLVGVHMFIATLTEGRLDLWSWLSGNGLSFFVVTAINAHQLSVFGQIPAQTITNPEEICNLLNPIYINTVPVNLTSSGEYAVADFMLPAKCQKLVIQVNKPYYASMVASLHTQLIAPLYKVKEGLYATNFTYSWEYPMNETKIMFAAMPYKMVASYETVYTTHGPEPVNMTPYMTLMAVVNDSTSPTNVRYYYGTVTKHDLRLIDPHNAGMMEQGKKFHIEYYYITPAVVGGDAAIHVMFNGTTVTSTIPRHARVIIDNYGKNSQTVSGYLQVIVGYEDQINHTFNTVDTHTYYFTMNLAPNSSMFKEWDIQKYVGEAINQYRKGCVGYVKLIGRITHAQYDTVKTNDFDSLVYYPPHSLTVVKPVVATIAVQDAITHAGIPNATVLFDGKSYTTNTTGIVAIPTTTGVHDVSITATGYYSKNTSIIVYTNCTYHIYMIPTSYTITPTNNSTNNTVYPIIHRNNTTYYPVETVVQYMDGAPVVGANVTMYNTSTGSVIGTGVTGGTGYIVIYVPAGENVTDNVTYAPANYSSQKVFVVNSPMIVQFTISENSSFFEPEVAVNNVSIWVHTGLGEFPNGFSMGPVYHSVDSWFYTNVPQNITFEITLIDLKTGNVITRENYTAHLHKGFQRVREFIPVNVSDFTTCQVECKIVKFQYDTNPYNNYAVGNVVTFRPFIDIYPTIVWFPVHQKSEYGITPGDTIKVCIAIHVPKKVHVPDIHLKYNIMSNEVGKHKMKMVSAKEYTINSVGGVDTIWYNYTMQIPWTNKVVVSASVANKYDLAPENNNVSITIPISPDAECVAATVQSLAVSAGSTVPVRVVVKSNYINTTGSIAVIDETNGNKTIGSIPINITAPEQAFIVIVHVPQTKKYSETQTWLIYVTEANDAYPKNNIKEITVTVWGFPSFVILGLIFLFVLIVLLLIKHLLTIRPPREGRYFRRIDRTDGGLERHLTIKHRDLSRGGRYFKKIK